MRVGECLGRLAGRHLEPQIHRCVAPGYANSLASECREQRLAFTAVGRARAFDVFLVVPGDDRCALHELLRRRADGRPELFQRGDQIRVGRDEPGAIARHGRPLAQCVEHRHVPAAARLECRVRRLVEPELGVRLVGCEQEPVFRREFGQPFEEVERRDRSGGIVRIVDPHDRGLRPVAGSTASRSGRKPFCSSRGNCSTSAPAKTAPRSGTG